jgi:hypothetical protein
MANFGGFVPHGRGFVKQIFIVFACKTGPKIFICPVAHPNPVPGVISACANVPIYTVRIRGEMYDSIDT